MIYLDHGASSYPKPRQVLDAILGALESLGGNPGRGAYRMAVETSRAIFAARTACANLLGVVDARDLAFVPSCTAGCNLMLRGVLRPGDRVIVGAMEHNAVVRPLAALAVAGIETVRIGADRTGAVDPADVERAVRAAPTRAIVCQHASNVAGTIQPIEALARIAREHDVLLLVDGAQSAGHLDLDLGVLGADGYAMAGHKALLGPQGIGLLYLAPALEAVELVSGGTGTDSESAAMPLHRPARYEAGTLNTSGIVGLGAACGFLGEHADEVRGLESALVTRLHEGVLAIGGFRVLGPEPGAPRVPVLALVHERLQPAEIASRLDRDYDIAVRAGLHCAPWAHETLGTLQTGAVRFGVGYGNTSEDIDSALAALAEICR
jgi:cysteine desulfurase family protein